MSKPNDSIKTLNSAVEKRCELKVEQQETRHNSISNTLQEQAKHDINNVQTAFELKTDKPKLLVPNTKYFNIKNSYSSSRLNVIELLNEQIEDANEQKNMDLCNRFADIFEQAACGPMDPIKCREEAKKIIDNVRHNLETYPDKKDKFLAKLKI